MDILLIAWLAGRLVFTVAPPTGVIIVPPPRPTPPRAVHERRLERLPNETGFALVAPTTASATTRGVALVSQFLQNSHNWTATSPEFRQF